jgi:hypothetical protein
MTLPTSLSIVAVAVAGKSGMSCTLPSGRMVVSDTVRSIVVSTGAEPPPPPPQALRTVVIRHSIKLDR